VYVFRQLDGTVRGGAQSRLESFSTGARGSRVVMDCEAFGWVEDEAVRSSAGLRCVGGGSQLSRLSQSLAIWSSLPAGLIEVEAGVIVHNVEAPIVLSRLEWELRVGGSPCRVDWRWLGLHVEVRQDAVDDQAIVDE